MKNNPRTLSSRCHSRTAVFSLPMNSLPFLGLLFVFFCPRLLFAATFHIQASTNPNTSIPQSLLAIPPRSWVVDTTAKELEALNYRDNYLRYRMHVVNAKGDQVRDVIESRDGTVARLLLRDGKPLTEQQDTDERERLTDMLKDPDAFAKHVKNSQSGKKVADQLIRLMPDAMIYTYAPGQPQTGKHPDTTEVVIDYEPNPKFHPPTTTAEALTGLRGRAWIDSKTKVTLRVEGQIFRGVNFGWGMLAHIYPGGHLVLDQADAGNGRWIFTRFTERISVRALMVKTLNIQSDVEAWGFQPVPSMSYQDAIRQLLNTPLPVH
ncbi:hypothetical protein BDD14_1238 [Edaphobacter modestus]|uniref:Uncharacterized protein n=2 Tax=Edaphobacter modestus TaxID=388466 RepID=A0A4Q7YSD0_9BACT|nr:hypothetical protein BDD14_1238 [Edaphobacter modestus]